MLDHSGDGDEDTEHDEKHQQEAQQENQSSILLKIISYIYHISTIITSLNYILLQAGKLVTILVSLPDHQHGHGGGDDHCGGAAEIGGETRLLVFH